MKYCRIINTWMMFRYAVTDIPLCNHFCLETLKRYILRQTNATFHQGLHCLLRAIPGKGVRGGDGRQL